MSLDELGRFVWRALAARELLDRVDFDLVDSHDPPAQRGIEPGGVAYEV